MLANRSNSFNLNLGDDYVREICVVGLGYIGLPTAIFFADKDYKVYGCDINEYIINSLQRGKLHIKENGLLEKLHSVIERKNLTFSEKPTIADIYMVAVPTPVNEKKRADLSYVEAAVHSILPYISKGNLIIIESTVPPKTIDDVIVPIFKEAGFDALHNDVYIAYCPERVIPGNILAELEHNDRIAGGYTEEAAEKAAKLFSSNIKGRVFQTTATQAEMIKLMENTYRDVNIALANELALIAEDLGIDVYEVIELANRHPRVQIHEPGPGVGGHCIPIDPYFIIEKACGKTPLISTARKINEGMPQVIIEQIEKLKVNHRIETISVLGLSYKKDVDDTRESSAIKIVNLLLEEGYQVKVHDPYVRELDIGLRLHSLEDSLNGSDLALMLVDHTEYKQLTSNTFQGMRHKVIFDAKNILSSLEGVTIYKLGQKIGNKNERVSV